MGKKCKICKSTDVISISAKCADQFSSDDEERSIIDNIYDGDYIEFSVCVNCGRIQEFICQDE